MKFFLRTVSQFLILPVVTLLLLVVGYIAYDPFQVIHSYDKYTSLQVNRSYISTEVFLKNYKQEHYNSFIFGSSRVFGYNVDSWKDHLGAEANVYSFDAYGDKISGMYHKLRLLDSLNVNIQNVLLTIDTDFTFTYKEHQPKFLFMEHPLLSGNGWFDFHRTHFLAYLDPSFILTFYGDELFMKMKGGEDFRKVDSLFDPITNNPTRTDLEKRVLNDEDYYNEVLFYTISDTLLVSPTIKIDDDHFIMLKAIKTIFEKYRTDYKVVINPLYDQVKFNPKDMERIINVFGEDKVSDFSGRNKFTMSKYNYYEISHFRPFVGDSIMNAIYKK